MEKNYKQKFIFFQKLGVKNLFDVACLFFRCMRWFGACSFFGAYRLHVFFVACACGRETLKIEDVFFLTCSRMSAWKPEATFLENGGVGTPCMFIVYDIGPRRSKYTTESYGDANCVRGVRKMRTKIFN